MVGIKKAATQFLALIQTHYPHKDISEYTRLVHQLEQFIQYGSWDEPPYDQSDCVSPISNFDEVEHES